MEVVLEDFDGLFREVRTHSATAASLLHCDRLEKPDPRMCREGRFAFRFPIEFSSLFGTQDMSKSRSQNFAPSTNREKAKPFPFASPILIEGRSVYVSIPQRL